MPGSTPTVLSQGQQIVIPGLEGMTGILETEIISFGDSLRSLSRRTQVSDEQLNRLNRLVSPTELYVGISLIIPKQDGQTELNTSINTGIGESLLELGDQTKHRPLDITCAQQTKRHLGNDPRRRALLPHDWSRAKPQDYLLHFSAPASRPCLWSRRHRNHPRTNTGECSVSGILVESPLHFFQTESEQVALQGVHALLEPGVYPLRLEATMPMEAGNHSSKWSCHMRVIIIVKSYMCQPIPLTPP